MIGPGCGHRILKKLIWRFYASSTDGNDILIMGEGGYMKEYLERIREASFFSVLSNNELNVLLKITKIRKFPKVS